MELLQQFSGEGEDSCLKDISFTSGMFSQSCSKAFPASIFDHFQYTASDQNWRRGRPGNKANVQPSYLLGTVPVLPTAGVSLGWDKADEMQANGRGNVWPHRTRSRLASWSKCDLESIPTQLVTLKYCCVFCHPLFSLSTLAMNTAIHVYSHLKHRLITLSLSLVLLLLTVIICLKHVVTCVAILTEPLPLLLNRQHNSLSLLLSIFSYCYINVNECLSFSLLSLCWNSNNDPNTIYVHWMWCTGCTYVFLCSVIPMLNFRSGNEANIWCYQIKCFAYFHL